MNNTYDAKPFAIGEIKTLTDAAKILHEQGLDNIAELVAVVALTGAISRLSN